METKDGVLIVGSGPAGSYAGLCCASANLPTTILEENTEVGRPVHCGECLSDICVQKFHLQLPPEVIARQVKGVRVIFPNGRNCSLNEKGYVLEKDLFEQWLASQAQDKGAELHLATKATGLEKTSAGFNVKTNKSDFSAKLVIDATGVTQFTSQALKLNSPSQTVMGLQYRMEDIPSEGYLDFYLWPEYAPHGYLWMIPKADGQANVGLVTTDGKNIQQYLANFVHKLGWQDKKILKTFGGRIPGSGPMEKTFSDNLMLIGDAAGFTSPLFEGGTHASLTSASLASQVAAKAFASQDFSASALSAYESSWKRTFPPYKTMVKGKAALYGFSSEELDEIGNLFPDTFDNFGALEKGLVGLKLLLAHPGYYARGIVPALAAFSYSRAENFGW